MERTFTLRTRGRKVIYGKIRGSLHRPVVVLVHGLSGHMDEALHYNAARFFEQHGFTSVRFNLYSWEPGGRKLAQCTLKIHARDLDAVVTWLRRRGAKWVYVVGHSYGAPTILHSQQKQFDGVVFWDGSYGTISRYLLKLLKVPGFPARVMDGGYGVLVGERMVQESTKVDSLALVRKLRVPMGFFYAGKGRIQAGGRAMYRAARGPKVFKVIPGAGHNFSEDGKQEQLFRATLAWLKNL